MLDIGWSELLIIGVVALVVVGPKELPQLLRSAGQWVAKARRMAGEFQSQMNDALREAELDGVKKSVDDLRSLSPKNILAGQLGSAVDQLGRVESETRSELAAIQAGLAGTTATAAPEAIPPSGEAAAPVEVTPVEGEAWPLVLGPEAPPPIPPPPEVPVALADLPPLTLEERLAAITVEGEAPLPSDGSILAGAAAAAPSTDAEREGPRA